MERQIKQLLRELGADVCGIAQIGAFASFPEPFSPTHLYAGCRSVIVFGKALPKGLSEVDPRFIYGYFNRLSAAETDRVALNAAKQLEKRFGAIAVPVPCDGPYEYWEKDTLTGKGLISVKDAAVAAGVGQLGKSGILLNPEYGSLLTIGLLLTDLALKGDAPCENICIPGCSRCVDACPAQAIGSETVNQKRCREYTYAKTERGFDVVNCNRCRMVCPKKYGR